MVEFIEEYGRVPRHRETFRGVNLGIKLSDWINKIKKELKDSERSPTYERLSDLHETLNVRLDESLQKNPMLSQNEWETLILEFIEEYGRTPQRRESFRGVNLGNTLNDWIRKIKRELKDSDESPTYDRLSSLNEILKTRLSSSLQKKPKTTLSQNEWETLMLEFIEEHGRTPRFTETFRDVNIGIALNDWITKIKREILATGRSSTHRRLSSLHPVLKDRLDRYSPTEESQLK